MRNSSPKVKQNKIDSAEAVRALEYLFAAGYVDKKRLYFANFMRGIFFSLGSIVGATLIITLLLWLLSLIGNVPFLSEVARNVRDTIQAK